MTFPHRFPYHKVELCYREDEVPTSRPCAHRNDNRWTRTLQPHGPPIAGG